jgi:hypothetical protein
MHKRILITDISILCEKAFSVIFSFLQSKKFFKSSSSQIYRKVVIIQQLKSTNGFMLFNCLPTPRGELGG